ncbi:MAG: YceD family protein [Bdellovibrionota bacterium]
MKINLSDIPEDGREYHWTRESKELDQVLIDVIDKNPYEAKFLVHPMNHRDFEISGSLKTLTKEQCSRCGIDFKFNIMEKFHSIIIPEQPQDRVGKYARVNHISESIESGPTVAEYPSNFMFDIGEYLHEVVALAVPFNPSPEEDSMGNCRECKIPVHEKTFNYNEELPKEDKPNPFAVLKNIKLQ